MVWGISGVVGVYRAVQYGVGHLMRTLPAGSSVGHGSPPVPQSPLKLSPFLPPTLALSRSLSLSLSLSLSISLSLSLSPSLSLTHTHTLSLTLSLFNTHLLSLSLSGSSLFDQVCVRSEAHTSVLHSH